MIKKLKIKYECSVCGSSVFVEREIVIDDYLKKIEIIRPKRCECDNKSKDKFEIKDIIIE